MKRHFQSVRAGLLLAVLAVLGAAGGIAVRGKLASRPSDESHSQEAAALATNHAVKGIEAPAPSDAAHEVSSAGKSAPNLAPGKKAALPKHEVHDTQIAANTLIEGDLLLHSARFGHAVRHYRHLLSDVQGGAGSADVQYRLGLCAEALGNEGEALSHYQQVTESAIGGVLEELARLGQARVLKGRGQTLAVQQLLRRWVLEENETFSRNLAVSHEALYFLGAISTDLALETPAIPLWSDAGLALPRRAFEPTLYLPSSFPAEARPGTEIGVGIRLTNQLQESHPDSTYFQARLARTSVERVLQQICELTGWGLDITSVAQGAIRAHTVPLDFTEKNAGVLLDLLLSPLGVGWTFQNRHLQILSESEMAGDAIQQYRRSQARRLLFAAIEADPRRGEAAGAYVRLGNLAFRDGDLPAARQHYERVLQHFPRSDVEAEAWFNLSKVATAQNEMPRARQALFGAVDAGRGRTLEQVASLLAGRQALLFDEPSKAIRLLVRSATLATQEDVKALSLLTLASAHLMTGHPEAANIALMEDRTAVQHDRYRDRAALLASLARFRAASSSERRDRDGEALIAALSHARSEDWFALHDHWLTCIAYEDIGLTEMALSVLASATEGASPSPLKTRMQFKQVELLSARRDFNSAETVLASLIKSDVTAVSLRARIALAELHVKSRDTDRAEEVCRELLKESLSEEQRIASLRLLGGIYSQRGDRQRAVLCFSGVAPQLSEATLARPRTQIRASLPLSEAPAPVAPPANPEAGR